MPNNNIHGNQPDNHSDDNHGKDFVEITIDNKVVSIHRGRESVEAIKMAGNIPLAYD
jgi:hypothetical protein